MIYPELREAAKGHWFSCYPSLSATVYYCVPFVGVGYMKERLSEFHQADV